MRANTRRALQSADLTIAVDVRGIRIARLAARVPSLIEQGYKAAEQHRAELLRLRGRRRGVAGVDRRPAAAPAGKRGRPHIRGDVRHRRRRRRRDRAAAGASRRTAARHCQSREGPGGAIRPRSIPGARVAADRTGDKPGLQVRARSKAYGPPFMMLGLNLENTTSSDFRVALAAPLSRVRRASARDRSCGSTASIGSDPHAAFSLHRPLFGTRLSSGRLPEAMRRTTDIIQDDHVIAEYREDRLSGGGDIGDRHLAAKTRSPAASAMAAWTRTSAPAIRSCPKWRAPKRRWRSVPARWPGQPGRAVARHARVGRADPLSAVAHRRRMSNGPMTT